MGWGLSHCLFWENCIGCTEKWNLLFPGTEQHLCYWSEKVWGGEDILWHLSSLDLSAASHVLCAGLTIFQPPMLQVWEIIANCLVKLRWVTVFLPPSLPHLSWWLQPVFNTFCPWKSVSSAAGLASATECRGFNIYYPLPAALVAIQEIPHTPATLWKDHDSPENILKGCQVVEHPPLQCLCVKGGFASLLSGMTKTTKAQPNGVLGSSQSF